MRIPYLGLLALGGAKNTEKLVLELDKQAFQELEQGIFWIKFLFEIFF